MSYRIEYDGREGKYEVRRTLKPMPKLLWVAGILLASALCLQPGSAEKLRSRLIPGEDAVTVQAFQNLSSDLRSGATMAQAVEAFCRYVIHGG